MTKEELEKLKVRDLIEMEAFRKEVEIQLGIEERTHTEALLNGILNRSPLDSLREKGLFNAEKMVDLFRCIIEKSLIGFSASERNYIYLIGRTCAERLLIRMSEEVKDN